MKRYFTQTILIKFAILPVVIFLSFQLMAQQAEVPVTFTQRTSVYSPNQKIYNIKGDFQMIGNTNMTYANPSTATSNSSDMIYVDVDGLPQTLNSSSATLEFSNENGADPNCTNVVYAGLYWLGRAHDSATSPHTFSVTKNNIPGAGSTQAVNYNQNIYNGAVSIYTGYTLQISRTGGNNNRTITYTFLPGTSVGGNRVDFVYAHNSGNQTLTVSVNQGAAVSVPTTSINANSAVLTSPYLVYDPSGGVAIEVVSLHRNGSNANVGDSYAYVHIHGTYTNSGTVTKNYDKSVVYLKHSNTTGYTQVNASDLNFTTNILYPSGNYGNMYTAYAEVTDYVRQHGTGMYTVADIALIEGSGGNTGYFGGWGMVVVYENSKMKWRDVTIFDGYAYIQGNVVASNELLISGFNTVKSGNVNMKLGLIAGEGDQSISGDYFEILPHDKLNLATPATTDWVRLSHNSNSTTNFFNSSIPSSSPRTPNLTDNSGIDIAMFNINNTGNSLVTNEQTFTKFRYGSSQDTYIIPTIAMAVDAYVPELAPYIEVLAVNGLPYNGLNQEVLPNGDISYTINLRNPGNEAVNNGVITIPIPYNASFVSASAQYFLGTGGSNPIQPYFVNTPPTGEIKWDIGYVPKPADPTDVLGIFTFTLKATNDCFLLVNQNCNPLISITGTASGVGENSQTIFYNLKFITGYGQNTCNQEPITGPLNVIIDAAEYVAENCGSVSSGIRTFNYCYNASQPSYSFADIAGQFPAGSRFYSAVIQAVDPITGQTYVTPDPNAVEYSSTNPFPNNLGEVTYYAIPPLAPTCWWEFKINISNCNLWYGTNSEDWGTPSNWTGNVVPLPTEDVIFATVQNYGQEAIRDLVLDQNRTTRDIVNQSSRKLIVPIDKSLIVSRDANTGAASQLVLNSKINHANGAIVFEDLTLNQSVGATVKFASKSKPAVGDTWPRVWQFFGPPVRNKSLTELFGTTVQGSINGGDPGVNTIVRKYDESLSIQGNPQEKWGDIGLNDIVTPYYGFEVTQPQQKFLDADNMPYSFAGSLVTDPTNTLNFSISSSGIFSRGNYILSNPYASPILISNMTTADFVNIDPTIYIYNTGSRQDWLDNNGISTVGNQPGTYTSIPINASTTIQNNQIPSMQGFMIKAISDGAPVTSFRFRYETVYKGSLTGINEPMRVRASENVQSENGIMPLIKMDILGVNSSDRVYLITVDGASKAYDPGWDGVKSLSSNVVQLFANDANGRKLQVNTDSDLNDTYVGLVSGGESTYTLRFTFNDEMYGLYNSLYIQDLLTGTTNEITNGMEMSVSATAGTVNQRFKLSASRISTSVHSDNISEALKLAFNQSDIIISNSTNENVQVTVYNLVGQPVFTKDIAAGLQTVKHGLSKGTYVIKAKTAVSGEKTILKSIINN